MGSFSANSYATAAGHLPTGLSTAVRRDLKISPSQYLADSAAAVRAVQVVASLKNVGVDVLGSSIDGTQLTVNIASAADSSTVQAADATAVVGAPSVPNYSNVVVKPVDSANSYGGEGYFYQESGQTGGNGYRCSIGFNGYNGSTGAPEFVTAGHCETTLAPGSSAYLLTQTAPTAASGSTTKAAALGTAVAGQYGGGEDYGLISSGDAGIAPQNSIATWGGSVSTGTGVSTGAPTASAPLPITGETQGIVGAALCKSGSSSGYTCGNITAVDQPLDVGGQTVNTIVATTCLLAGDSGGGAVVTQTTNGVLSASAVGIDSGTSSVSDTSCANPVDSNGNPAIFVFFPMVSAGSNSVSGQQGSNWQLGVSVSSTVSVSSPANAANVSPSSSITGTITGAGTGSTAILYLDGSTTPFAKANASSGSFSIPLTGVGLGAHTYSIAAGIGWSAGTPVTGSFTVVGTPSTPVLAALPKCTPLTASTVLTGTVGGASAGTTVSISFDGGATAFATVPAANGSWAIPLNGLGNGNHVYYLTATSGAGSVSGVTAGTITMTNTSGSGAQDASEAAVFRFFDTQSSDHFYTMSQDECRYILATWPTLWSYEGIAYNAFTTQVPGSVPLYRYWSTQYQGHFFTADAAENVYVQQTWPTLWTYEGIDYYVYPEDTSTIPTPTPATLQVARFWSAEFHQHFYSEDPAEIAGIEASYPSYEWSFENYNFRVPAS